MKTFTSILLLLFSCVSFSQDEIVAFTAYIYNESDLPLQDVIINTYKNDSLFRSDTTKSDGIVKNIVLPIGSNYRMLIGKQGYVSKIAAFDAHFKSANNLWTEHPNKFEVTLFKPCDAGDFEFMKTEPLINYQYDSSLFFRFDKVHYNEMRTKVKEANLSEADQETFATNYFEGLKEMQFQRYDRAKAMFLKVKEIADCPYVIDKIENCKVLHKIQLEYDRYMEEAKGYFEAKNYQDADETYNKASTLKPNEIRPIYYSITCRFELAIIKADEYFAAKDYASALKYYDLAAELIQGETSFKRNHKKCLRKVK